MQNEEYVILVDLFDNEIGVMEKQQAHVEGLLHRAFSVFIFNTKGELLLQQRAKSKYHSPGLWTNACCSHPRKGETILDASNRRLEEEMGLFASLKVVDYLIYKADFDNGLTEHEYDYIVIGTTDNIPQINKDEVESFCYKSVSAIEHEIKSRPEYYTEWFKLIFPKILILN
jgi:isopentenyl-diphosphate Delta-isomerase